MLLWNTCSHLNKQTKHSKTPREASRVCLCSQAALKFPHKLPLLGSAGFGPERIQTRFFSWVLFFTYCKRVLWARSMLGHLVVSNSLQPHGFCSPSGSSVQGILQATILEWVAISFSRGSSWPRDQVSSVSPAFQADSLPTEPSGKPTTIKWSLENKHCYKRSHSKVKIFYAWIIKDKFYLYPTSTPSSSLYFPGFEVFLK